MQKKDESRRRREARRRLRKKLGLKAPPAHKSPDPTPQEIIERSAEIRATWTVHEEAHRRGVRLEDCSRIVQIPEFVPPPRHNGKIML